MSDGRKDRSVLTEGPAEIETRYVRNPYSDLRKIDNSVLTIRKVINGFIVHTLSGPEGFQMSEDTLVFNSIDDLCEALKIYYEGEENESK